MKGIQSFRRPRAWAFLPSAAAILTLLLSTASSSFAGSATWKATPANTDWNSAANWIANGPPNGPADTATFATSNIKRPVISATTEVNGIVFNPGASAFTITSPFFAFTISGVGITNNSGITQNFVSGPTVINFLGSATAGSSTLFTNTGDITFGDSATAGNASFTNNAALKFGATSTAGNATVTNNVEILFFGNSTAGNATFTNAFGIVIFSDEATAGNATFVNAGGTASGTGGGFTVFDAGSTAGNATVTTNGATVSDAFKGQNLFEGDAGNATLIANGGSNGGEGGFIQYRLGSTGGTARVEVFGNGTLDISQHDAPGVTTGSIEGSGLVFLGGVNLAVGTNNLSTTFSGLVQDGGFSGGTGGSLTKTGTGTLTLSGANTYTGNTTINAGTLLVSNTTGSATGTGAVNVNAGTLGGGGTISGQVTIGTGNGAGAILAPAGGTRKQATFTTQSAITFNADSTYTYTFRAKGNKSRTDKVVALGATVNSGAIFAFRGTTQGALQAGLVLTAIDNTSATPISGTFSNLSDGAVLTANGNNFKANYEGGDGNDLTLTVVP
jgi:autotransporter-associated beta strand protein